MLWKKKKKKKKKNKNKNKEIKLKKPNELKRVLEIVNGILDKNKDYSLFIIILYYIDSFDMIYSFY